MHDKERRAWLRLARTENVGPVTFRKINALTGKEVWKWEINAQYNAVNGGMMATPALGFGDVSDLVFVTMARTASEKQGDLVALDKKTGQVVWQRTMGAFSWSSPLLIQGSDGHVYGIQGDSSGLLHLFDPNTGKDFVTSKALKNLRVDGGAAQNDLLMQLQADLLGVEIVRPQMLESTALGAGLLAGLGVGLWRSVGEVAAVYKIDRRFSPSLPAATVSAMKQRWAEAVSRC